MALDHAAAKIRVNVLCRGPIDTHAEPGRFAQMIVDVVPLQRIGAPDKIARVALFLASDESSFMTGSTVVADGGTTAQ